MKQHYVLVQQSIEITEQEFERIGKQWLSALKEERWSMEDGLIYEEFVTSHRYDSAVGKITDPKFEILLAVEKLEGLLEKRDKKSK